MNNEQEEIRRVARLREFGLSQLSAIEAIEKQCELVRETVNILRGVDHADQRMVEIGAAQLELGFMALLRAATQPGHGAKFAGRHASLPPPI